MTNGEKIQQIFPDAEISIMKFNYGRTKVAVDWKFEQIPSYYNLFYEEWWNAEYKELITKNDLPQTMETLFKYLTDKIPSWKVILIDKWTDFKVWLWLKTHKGVNNGKDN